MIFFAQQAKHQRLAWLTRPFGNRDIWCFIWELSYIYSCKQIYNNLLM